MVDKSSECRTSTDFAVFEDKVSSYTREGPVRKTPGSGDSLRDILEVLYSEHRYISSLLDALEKQAQRLQPGKIPDYRLLLDIVDYLTHYPGQYHHPREDMLFTSMLESDKAFKPRLDRLLREHATLEHYNLELLNKLTMVADGRPANRPELLQTIRRYVTGYREHIDYESQEIFPSAKGSLSPSDLKRLGSKTRYIDDPLFGGEAQYRYQRVRRNLQSRLEIVGSNLVAREMSGIESFIGNVSRLVDTLTLLRTTAAEQRREAWREQVDTVKEHTRTGEGPGLASLPLALAKNHRRHWQEGFSNLRKALAERDEKGR